MTSVKKLPKLLLIVALLALEGCDFIYGVNRVGLVGMPSNWECIRAVIRTIPEITDVEYREDVGSQPLTWKGIQKPTIVRRFIYKTASLANEVYFTERFDGTIEYHHGRYYLNHKPPQSELDKYLPLIHQVEISLRNKCELGTFLPQEHCYGMKCSGVDSRDMGEQ